MKFKTLKKRSDFLRVQKSKRRWVSPSMTVAVDAGPVDERRYGLTVTKKTAKRAVDRNRIKRRLRHAITDIGAEKIPAGTDAVILARAESLTKKWDDLKRDLKWCLKRAVQK